MLVFNLVKLLVLRSLEVFDGQHRKAGVFPLVVELHEQLGYETTVVVVEPPTTEARRNFENSTKCALIAPPEPTLLTKFSWKCRKYLRHALRGVTYPVSEEIFPALAEVKKAVGEGLKISAVGALMGAQRTGALALEISRYVDAPYWVWEHATHFARGFSGPRTSEAVQAILREASLVTAVSPGLKSQILKHLDSYISIKILPHALSDSQFNPVQPGVGYGTFSRGRFLFGAWTNWREFKRLDLLLDALENAVVEEKNICLIVAGPLPTWAYKGVADRNLDDHVLLTGPLNRIEIKELSHSVDCVVVPSDHETFALPVIEAFAAGKPAVVTRSGGPEYLISSSSLGAVVPRGNKNELSSAMLSIASASFRFVPESIVAHCKTNYSGAAFKNKLSEIYRSIEE